MSFGVWIEVPCSKCSVTASGYWSFDNTMHRRQLARDLKAIGWKRSGDDWLCRHCKAADDPRRCVSNRCGAMGECLACDADQGESCRGADK